MQRGVHTIKEAEMHLCRVGSVQTVPEQGCGATCFSGSTLDSSSLDPGSIPAAGAAADQAERRLRQTSGRGGSPPSREGGWRGALLLVAGHIFPYAVRVLLLSFAACVRMFLLTYVWHEGRVAQSTVGNAAAISPLHSSRQGVRPQST